MNEPRLGRRMDTGSKALLLASAGMALILVGAFAWDAMQPEVADDRILDVCMQDHSHEMLHYHAELHITIRGEGQMIPAETGVIPGCMKGIHTHDDTGKLHIETPEKMEARLEHFFTIWGKTLSEDQLLDARVEAGESITLTVDGEPVEDPAKHIIEDGQVLELNLG